MRTEEEIEQKIDESMKRKSEEMKNIYTAALFKLHEAAMDAANNPTPDRIALVRDRFHRWNILPILLD